MNSQLRGIIDPEIEPSPAWGHVQIKLREDGAEGCAVEWKGKLFNPDGDIFSGGFIVNPEIMPPGEIGDGDEVPGGGALVLAFFRGTTESCDILSFDSQATTDEEHRLTNLFDGLNYKTRNFYLFLSIGTLAGN